MLPTQKVNYIACLEESNRRLHAAAIKAFMMLAHCMVSDSYKQEFCEMHDELRKAIEDAV